VLRLRRRRRQLRPLAEAEAYARSYGQRSDEVTNVKPLERDLVEPEPDAAQPPARLTDRRIRDAFLARMRDRA